MGNSIWDIHGEDFQNKGLRVWKLMHFIVCGCTGVIKNPHDLFNYGVCDIIYVQQVMSSNHITPLCRDI